MQETAFHVDPLVHLTMTYAMLTGRTRKGTFLGDGPKWNLGSCGDGSGLLF
jgi:hypothetical protein